jgi:hypothetical protein
MKTKTALLRSIGVLMALLVFMALANSLLATPCDPCFDPTFDIIPGAGNQLKVKITSGCPSGATIYYTINGGTPTHSSPSAANGVEISVPYGYTYCIRALAAFSGKTDSGVSVICQHNPEG